MDRRTASSQRGSSSRAEETLPLQPPDGRSINHIEAGEGTTLERVEEQTRLPAAGLCFMGSGSREKGHLGGRGGWRVTDADEGVGGGAARCGDGKQMDGGSTRGMRQVGFETLDVLFGSHQMRGETRLAGSVSGVDGRCSRGSARRAGGRRRCDLAFSGRALDVSSNSHARHARLPALDQQHHSTPHSCIPAPPAAAHRRHGQVSGLWQELLVRRPPAAHRSPRPRPSTSQAATCLCLAS